MHNSIKSAQTSGKTQGYNGWSNYETWCVNLWLSNDEGTYTFIRELTQQANDTFEAADLIREAVEEMNPLQDEASLFADLVNAALSEVDWVEIAEDFSDE